MLGAIRLLSALVLLLAAAPTFAAKRVALVIGNDQYDSLPDLQKAVNDARAVGGALKSLGFEVIAGENVNRRDMNRRLADLESAVAPGDDVFFFYAGHGVALGAENYLLPVDMPSPQPGEEGLVRNEGHAADAIIRAIQRRGAAVSFVVLDACRNNPFSETGTRDVGLSRGLSRIDAPAGVFVLFSAGIGQTALDRLSNTDPDPNSVFTRKLVPLLGQAGLTHVDLAKQVQEEVAALAATIKHAQAPAYYDQIIGRVVLKAGEKAAPASPEVTALAEQVKKLQDDLAKQKQDANNQQQVAVLKKPQNELEKKGQEPKVSPFQEFFDKNFPDRKGAESILGLSLKLLDDADRQKLGIADEVRGILIDEVAESSQAAEKGIKAGEIIVEIGQEAVASPAEAAERVEKLKKEGRRNALVMVSDKNGDIRFVVLRIAG